MKIIFIISISILSAISYAAETINFTVKGIDKDKNKCLSNDHKYIFTILGEIEGECTDSQSFPIKLIDNDEATTCTLSCSTTSLNCEIDITKYPLSNINILISETKPESDAVNLPNWTEFFNDVDQATVDNGIICKNDIETIDYTALSYDENDIGCVWTNSSFSIIGKLTQKTNPIDLLFTIKVSRGQQGLEDEDAYCRIPATTESTDIGKVKMSCSINLSHREIEIINNNVNDETGGYNILLTGNNVKLTLGKCTGQRYLIQKILFSIILLGLLI